MLKPSKIQISLAVSLGLLVVAQLSFVMYKGYCPCEPSEINYRAEVPKSTYNAEIPHSELAKAPEFVTPPEKNFEVGSVKELDSIFDRWDYNLKKAKSEGTIPRLYLAKLPGDMTRKKKSSNHTFVQALLPHILNVNEKILADRGRLLEMQKRQKKGRHLHHSEKMWLSKLVVEYRCKSTKVESLLVHVDVIPPSLALAQATLETGGGRSHAARKKNSTFGHMTKNNKVETFKSLQDSVEAYVKNLNRHTAYASFRKARADLRAKNQKLCGHILAVHLTKYSIRGVAYTKDLQNLIHRFDLKSYDHVTLEHMRVKP